MRKLRRKVKDGTADPKVIENQKRINHNAYLSKKAKRERERTAYSDAITAETKTVKALKQTEKLLTVSIKKTEQFMELSKQREQEFQ